MKFNQALLALLATTASVAVAIPTHRRLDYDSLSSSSSPDLLLEALSQNGLVSITNLPNNFHETKRSVLSRLHACLMDMEGIDDGAATVAMTTRLRDGTIRRSIATTPSSTLPSSLPDTTACRRFQADSAAFRASVNDATEAFADRLSTELGAIMRPPVGSGSPVMTSRDGSKRYETVKDVIEGGEQLEHFHSYQSGVSSLSFEKEERRLRRDDDDYATSTIALHMDQGFFIAFTPGMIVQAGGKDMTMSDGFYIEDSQGRRSLVQFDDEDDLVFMMGDGVNQYINNRLLGQARPLHATPHSLTITPQNPSAARVWYGRMVLPPNDAYNPQVGASYGDIRRLSIEATSEGRAIPAGVGCSSTSLKALIQDTNALSNTNKMRFLAEEEEVTADAGGEGAEESAAPHGVTPDQCTENELFCWFRCMPLDFEDSQLTHPSVCAERNLKLQCTSPRDEVVPNGDQHGDYYPGCTNSTDPPSAYPLIDQADEATCTDSLWEAFHASGDGYDHFVDLTHPMGDETYLMWSVLDNGVVKARLAHNNVFGFLSTGFANELDTVHNGMNGGHVVLAIPGGNYSPVTGLDLNEPASVDTYTIHETESAFRHWQDPIDTAESISASVESTECFTAISFESDNINGQKFNVDGTDEMIWAANSADHFVGYHLPFNRARFTIDWKNGVIVQPEDEDAEVVTAENGDGENVEGEQVSLEEGDEAEVVTAENGDGENGEGEPITAEAEADSAASVFAGAGISVAVASVFGLMF